MNVQVYLLNLFFVSWLGCMRVTRWIYEHCQALPGDAVTHVLSLTTWTAHIPTCPTWQLQQLHGYILNSRTVILQPLCIFARCLVKDILNELFCVDC